MCAKPREIETDSGDDAIIGRVFRWSLVVIVAIGLIVVAGLFLTRERAPRERAIEKDVGRISDLVQESQEMPAVRFVDVTREAGIDFVHVNGAEGEKLLPETMGGGVAFLDYDGDGDQDLLFINGDHWPRAARAASRPTPELYRNDGFGRFAKVTREVGLDLALYGTGVAAGDFDNDGDVDLFLAALGPNRLLRNDAGRFVDVTASSGVAGGEDSWSASAGFLDYDNDGDLDLFVCNYIRWSRETDLALAFSLNGRDRAYGPPTQYGGTFPYLYRNDGDGRFTDVSEQAGIRVRNPITGAPMAKALGLAFADIDGDRFLDLFVANDTVQNLLFHNRGDGTFEEIGATSGLGFDGTGNSTGAMGIDTAYYRNDRQFAVGMANFANEMSSFFVAQDTGLMFTDEAAGEGIGAPSRLVLSFGLFFFDYDLDGRLDLLQANGHLENEINQVQASQRYRQAAQLFWNAGPEARSCFAEVPGDTLGDLSHPIVGRGAAYADIDSDGDLDVVITQAGGPPVLLRNDQDLGHNWLRIKLTGTQSNRDAIGAWVELQAGGVLQRRQVSPTRSYLSQVELALTFGLGTAQAIDSIRIVWPDGAEQEVAPPAPNRTIEVVQSRPPSE